MDEENNERRFVLPIEMLAIIESTAFLQCLLVLINQNRSGIEKILQEQNDSHRKQHVHT
jgi:hypothetical protein